uniref:Uncharacterized protein n=1 Tax=Zooxanthella nutricula TaxID=1333877 RepID=A0A7S2Q4Y9_9DINO
MSFRTVPPPSPEAPAPALTDDEAERLEEVKAELRACKTQLSEEGLLPEEVNKHPKVLSLVESMQHLRDKEVRAALGAEVVDEAEAEAEGPIPGETLQITAFEGPRRFETQKEAQTNYFHQKRLRREGRLGPHFFNQPRGREMKTRRALKKEDIKEIRGRVVERRKEKAPVEGHAAMAAVCDQAWEAARADEAAVGAGENSKE